jgi:hypothetical protein
VASPAEPPGQDASLGLRRIDSKAHVGSSGTRPRRRRPTSLAPRQGGTPWWQPSSQTRPASVRPRRGSWSQSSQPSLVVPPSIAVAVSSATDVLRCYVGDPNQRFNSSTQLRGRRRRLDAGVQLDPHPNTINSGQHCKCKSFFLSIHLLFEATLPNSCS